MTELTPEEHLDIFLRSHRTVGLRLTQMFAEAGAVPPSEARVLTYISRASGHRMRIDALSQELGMTKGAVSRIVDRLERAGRVERMKSSEDRRATFASMTPAGRDALRHATLTFRAVFEDIFLNGLDRAELASMSLLLQRLEAANATSRPQDESKPEDE